MPAYWVARSKINDPVEYKKYTDLVPDIIAKYGGKVLARGGDHYGGGYLAHLCRHLALALWEKPRNMPSKITCHGRTIDAA